MTTPPPSPAALRAAEAIEMEVNDCLVADTQFNVATFAAIINRETQRWLPIAEAPKDGTPFIGTYGRRGVFTTWWQPYHVFGPEKPGGGCDVVGTSHSWAHDEGDSIHGGEPKEWIPMPATLQPLPTPPTEPNR